ncbi:hypothetical protein DM02DRAFT_668127 [Periconia macrospinosa]|uniref:Zn(2)-C6 fungal-type domain-containing protein n=1 Tax=Periconia macrospinosa TaxID=97972 RepID=A0A2V1E6T2_9PLEO|nr:hypothetical protein DM02DRAFT_668127 [Periconia macrospinosa]
MPMAGSTHSGSEPARKRKRLTHACTQCRSRKIRCDEARPKCTNCDKAGTECITLDPRNPGVLVERREAQKRSQQCSPADVLTPLSATQGPHPETEQRQRPHSGSESQVDDVPDTESRVSPDSELLPALPRHASGYNNSLSMLSQWLDLAFIRLGIPQHHGTESPVRNLNKARTEVISTGALRELSSSVILAQSQNFMGGLNTVLPIFTRASMDRLMLDWENAGSSFSELHDSGMTSILMALIVAASVQTSQTSLAGSCLNMALSNLQFIVENRSIHSIRALILISMVHRCRDDIVLASNMISLAASNAQALGLHRQISSRQRRNLTTENLQEFSLIWSSIFVLEKIISLELGRLSTIRDFECNQVPPSSSDAFPSHALHELFLALFGLSKIQSEISERFALSRHMEESTNDIDSAIRAKIEMVGELDQKLLSWTQSLPPYAQTLSYTIGDPELRLAMPFLALQYWQTLFIIHRNALLLNPSIISKSADQFCTDKPYKLRIKNGQSICCIAARTIVSILNDIYEHEASSIFMSSYAPLIAVYALDIHIIRNPQLGLARADSEIQANAAEMVAKHQRQSSTYDDPEAQALRQLLANLHTEVVARLSRTTARWTELQPAPVTHVATPQSHRTFSPPDLEVMSSDVPSVPLVTPNLVIPPFASPLNNSFLFDMSNVRMNQEFPDDPMEMMQIDWETLALTYGLPSQ